jgi:hypothetical protein
MLYCHCLSTVLRILHQKDTRKSERIEVNGTHQSLVYADDVNILDENINTIKENPKALLEASKRVGLEVNIEKNKYMVVSCHQSMTKSQFTD